jgi:hypothetical protein
VTSYLTPDGVEEGELVNARSERLEREARVLKARAECEARGVAPLASTGLTDDEYAADVAKRLGNSD